MTQSIEPAIAVVIPTFNRKEVTRVCIENLLAGTYKNIQIIVCDSNSTDGTRDALSMFPHLKVMNVGTSSWWSAAVNRGIESALATDCSCILVLNDDIDFSRDLIELLIKKGKLYPNKIISPSQVTKKGIYLGTKYEGIFRDQTAVWAPQDINSTTDVSVASSNGCCLLIPRSVFKTIGLFDEVNCPHLYGDTEFQIRAFLNDTPTIACPTILIKQHANTDYFKRIKLRTLFTFEASPVHFWSHLTFGKTLFGGTIRFTFYGFRYHFIYFKSLVKCLMSLAQLAYTSDERAK